MREDNGKRVISAGIWYTICNIVLKGLSVLTAPFFNRVLTQGEVGEYSNVTAWAGILLILTTWELYSSVSNAKIDYRDGKFDEYMSSNLILGTIITGICSLVLVAFREFICEFMGLSYEVLLLVLLNFFASEAISLCLAKYRVFLQYKQTVALTVIMSMSTVVTSVILVLLMEDNFMARVIGSYAPTIVIGVIAYFLILRKSRCIRPKYCKYILGISLPLVFHVLAGTILNSSDRIIIRDFCGNEDTALYSVAYTIASIVQIIWTSVSSAWVPWCYDRFAEEKYVGVNKSMKVMLVAFATMTIIVMLLAPEALFILGGETYVKAKWVVPPILAGCLVTAAYTLYVNVEQYHKKTVYVAVGTVVAAIINIVLNLIFIPIYGYAAAAYTTLASYLVLFVFHFAITEFVIKKKGIYSSRFVMIYLGFACLLPVAVSMVYRRRILRYGIIAALILSIGVFAFRQRSDLVAFLRKQTKTK